MTGPRGAVSGDRVPRTLSLHALPSCLRLVLGAQHGAIVRRRFKVTRPSVKTPSPAFRVSVPLGKDGTVTGFRARLYRTGVVLGDNAHEASLRGVGNWVRGR